MGGARTLNTDACINSLQVLVSKLKWLIGGRTEGAKELKPPNISDLFRYFD